MNARSFVWSITFGVALVALYVGERLLGAGTLRTVFSGASALVIVATLVFQGLTLPALIRVLDVSDDGGAEREEAKARIRTAEAALARLEELLEEGTVRPKTAERLRGSLGFRRDRFLARFDDGDDGAIEERSAAYQRVMRDLLAAEHAALFALRNDGVIDDNVMQRIQRDLDLEAARLDQ